MQKWNIKSIIFTAFILELIQSINSKTINENKNESPKSKKDEEKNNLIYLTIQLCQSWSYKSYFMEIQQIMEKNFKNVIVNGEEYPLSQTRKFLSYSVMAIQFLIKFLNI